MARTDPTAIAAASSWPGLASLLAPSSTRFQDLDFEGDANELDFQLYCLYLFPCPPPPFTRFTLAARSYLSFCGHCHTRSEKVQWT